MVVSLFGSGAPGANLALENVSVKDFGAVGDGVTDDTTAIQNAINSAQTLGRALTFVDSDTYKITSALICSGNNLTIYGKGATLDGSSIAAATTLDQVYGLKIEGSIGSAVVIGANLNEGATAVGSTTTAGLSAGDYVFIYSTDIWPIGDINGGRYMGELHQVRSVTDGANFVLMEGASFPMLAANGLSYKRVVPVSGINVYNLKVKMGGTNKAHCGIRIKYAVNCKLIDCETTQTEDCGVRSDTSLNCGVHGGKFSYCRSPGDGSSGVTGTTGYGINPAAATKGFEVIGALIYGCRHAIAGGGTYPSISTRIADNLVMGGRDPSLTANYSLDCHEDCLYWTFENNHVYGDVNSTGSGGIQVRGIKTRVVGNTFVNSFQYGVYIKNFNNPGNSYGTLVAGNRIINSRLDGIVSEGSSTSPQYDISISDNYIYTPGGEGITLLGTERAQIVDNEIKPLVAANKSSIRLVGTATSLGNRCRHIVITGNLALAPTLYGIRADYADHITIVGNNFTQVPYNPLNLTNCTAVSISGDVLNSTYAFGSAISLSACVGVAINGVVADNSSGAAASDASGVSISGASTDIAVSGCQFKSFNRGVYSVAPANYIAVTGINARTSVTTSVDVSASANTAVAGNL